MNENNAKFFDNAELAAAGLTIDMIIEGLEFTNSILDLIDQQLLSHNSPRLANIVELANFSSIVGNLLGSGIARSSNGVFKRNGPHKYPDLLALVKEAENIEIKMALEDNNPKGHLAKAGYYLTCRYVLSDANGQYKIGKENRGDVILIWELRFGNLAVDDFNISNTEGDSGKTAVINKKGMSKMKIIYCNLNGCPYSERGPIYKRYKNLFESQSHLH